MKTIQQFTGELQAVRGAFSPSGTGTEALMLAACTGVLDLVRKRIHVDGKAADGSDIGQYDSPHPPTLVGGQPSLRKSREGNATISHLSLHMLRLPFPSLSVSDREGWPDPARARGRGESGRHVWNNNSRNANRRKQYKAGGRVTLTGTGKLRDELTVIAQGSQSGLGWAGGGAGVKNQRLSLYDLALALEKTYGKKIWALTDSERKEAMQAAQMAANEYIGNALS